MAGQSAMLTRAEAAKRQKAVECESLSVNHAKHGSGADPELHSQKGTKKNPDGHKG